MSYSLSSIFGNKTEQITNSASTNTAGNSQYKKMIPPHTVDGDTIKITGFVPNVIVKEWKFDEEKNQVVVVYESTVDGSTQMDWYLDPKFDERIQKQTETVKQIQEQIALGKLIQITKSYVYSSTVNNALVELEKSTGGNFSYKQLADTLEALLKSDKNKTNNDISLKVLPTTAQGIEPKYRVATKNGKFIGQTGSDFGPQFVKPDEQYGDIVTFTKIEETADFTNSSVDDIFVGSDIELL